MCARETQLILIYISCVLLTYPYADIGLVMQMRAGHFALKLSLRECCSGHAPGGTLIWECPLMPGGLQCQPNEYRGELPHN